MKNIFRKFPVWWTAAVLCAILLFNVVMDMSAYRNYQNIMDILAELVQEEEATGLDAMAGIMKGSPREAEQGRQILKEYGYLELGQTVYGRQFIKECIVIAAVSLLFGALIMLLLWKQKQHDTKEQDEMLAQIAHCLLKFRENTAGEWMIDGDRDAVHRVNHQLNALQNCLQIIQEQAVTEKEKTKSLVTDISHQLKTPVAALDTCLTILEQEDLGEEERLEFTKRCRSSLDGLELLLQSLLQISRLEAGMVQIKRIRASIFETVVTAVNRIYSKASEKQIELSMDYEKELEQLQILQDTKWLCEALLNILENAVKYSDKESEIEISLQKRSALVRIEITDQGIGIPKEEYHKIFQRFYRGTLPKVREESGSGVGLYLVREIIQKHHGTVSVTSAHKIKAGEKPGSTFVVQIPLEG